MNFLSDNPLWVWVISTVVCAMIGIFLYWIGWLGIWIVPTCAALPTILIILVMLFFLFGVDWSH